ncbi:MAG: ADP-ribosylglycohydrolase family protein [Halanaerobiales bacterium]
MRTKKIQNTLIGLAVGDSLGWPAIYHRSHLFPFWTRRLRRDIDYESESKNVIRPLVPFSLNISQEPFEIGPSHNTEWSAFILKMHLNKSDNKEQTIKDYWRELLKDRGEIKSGISVIAALNNMYKGIMPPASGHDNPHYFDDAAVIRAITIGALNPGKPKKAIELVDIDGSVTNSEDGLWAAKGISAAISIGVDGGSVEEMEKVLIDQLPEDSWIYYNFKQAMNIIEKSENIFVALPELADKISQSIYSYGAAAPETLPIAFAIFKMNSENIKDAITSSTSLARTAETVPAIVGALAGSYSSSGSYLNSWGDRLKILKGISIPKYEGVNYFELIESNIDEI